MPQEAFWPFFKYCGFAAIVGFICGTALAHIIIYALTSSEAASSPRTTRRETGW